MDHYEDLYRMGHVKTAGIAEPDDFIVDFASTLGENEPELSLMLAAGSAGMRFS